MAILLLVCFLTMAFGGIVLANPVVPNVIATHHHPSFWMKYGRFAVGLGLLAWIICENSHNSPSTPAAQEPPEMLPGDRVLHNVYGDNIPKR